MPPVVVAVGAAVAAYGAAAVVGGGIIGAIVGAAASIAVSYVGNAIFSDDAETQVSVSDFGRGVLLNKASNTEAIPVIYGSRRVGGARVFMAATDVPAGQEWVNSGYWEYQGEGQRVWVDTSGYEGTTPAVENGYLHIVMALCEGPIAAINTVYFNDVASTDERFDGLVLINKHLGEDDQAADADLMAACPDEWTSDHRLCGVAYLYIRLKWDSTAFATGLPVITADVDGRTVYDPRTATTAMSHNPALNIRDYLTNSRYGRGIPAALVPDTFIIAAANYCDEIVTVGGVQQARYTCDGAVNVDNSALENTRQLLSSCRGMLIFSGGLYKLKIDKVEVSTFDFTEDNITGAWNIPLGTKRNTYNRIRAKFFNPETSWQEDIAPVESTALRELDNDLVLETELSLPFTADANTAKQIATIELSQSRQQLTCRFTAFISGMRCEVGDVVTITHSTPGWSAKKFRVLAIALKNNDEVTVTAREYADTVYDFGTILAYDSAPNTTLPSLDAISPPYNLEVEEEFYDTGQDLLFKVNLTWDPPPDAFAASYDVAYKLSAATEWIPVTNTKARSVSIPHLAGGTYKFRVRAINTLGVASAWAEIERVIDGLPDAPAAPADFTATLIGRVIELSWTPVDDVAVKGYTVYLNDVAIAENIAGTTYQYRGTLTAGLYNFELVSVDAYGQEGASIAAAGITISAPSAPVVTSATNGETVTLRWGSCRTSLDIDYYTVDGHKVASTAYSERVSWASKTFAVKAVDVCGNESTATNHLVTIPTAGAVTAITAVGKVFAIQLHLTYQTFPDFQAVEIWASQTNDRATATLVGETTGNTFTHCGLGLTDVWYYWTRIRDTSKEYGAWYPSSATAGVSGTVSSDPDDYLDILEVDESRLSETLRTRIAWIDSGVFIFTGDYVQPDVVAGMNGVFNTLAALQVNHETRMAAAEVSIQEGIDGEWASISSKAATAVVDAIDSRVSIAEQDITAGKAGTWASISSRATTAALSDAVDRISAAETNIDAGIAGTWASISSRALTSTVTGIDSRLTIAEQDIDAGQAGTWGSISSKLATATYNTDTKDANGYSRIAALENRFIVYDTTDAPAWSSATTYYPGTIVKQGSSYYRCIRESLNHQPPNGTYWVQISAGLLSEWTLKLNVNNHVAGVGMMLDGSGTSEFIILADKFKIMHPSDTGDPQSVFTVGTIGGSSAVGIRGDLIVDGSILANALTSGTITSKQITLALTAGGGDVAIKCGKTDFGSDANGFILGIDDSDSDSPKFEIGDATKNLKYSPSTGLVVTGPIISTTNIEAGAVSQSGMAYSAGSVTSGTLTFGGGKVLIMVTFSAAVQNLYAFHLDRDGTPIWGPSGYYNSAFTICVVDTPGAGNHTYTATCGNADGNTGITMTWLEMLR